MFGLAAIICLIGILALFMFLITQLGDGYLPIKLFLWLCTPLLINVGLYFSYQIVLSDFSNNVANVFSTLFQVGIYLMWMIYVYMAGWGILVLFKNFRDKKYIERQSKI